MRYTKEEKEDAISRYYKEFGIVPTSRALDKSTNYPSANTIKLHFGSWNKGIEAAELTPNQIQPNWSNKDIENAIPRYYKKFSKIPTRKDFDNNSKYPDSTTLHRVFGSWNKGIEAAGFEPNTNLSNQYSTPTKGLDGRVYLSMAEAYLFDTQIFERYNYDPEPFYPNSRMRYDWYLSDLDIYIELDGGLRPWRIKEKIQINKDLNRKCLFINISDIYKKNFSLEELIYE